MDNKNMLDRGQDERNIIGSIRRLFSNDEGAKMLRRLNSVSMDALTKDFTILRFIKEGRLERYELSIEAIMVLANLNNE